MSKIYKVELYFVDAEDDFSNKDDFKDEVENLTTRLWGITHIAKVEESKEFEWDDDLDINSTNATEEDYKKYFD